MRVPVEKPSNNNIFHSEYNNFKIVTTNQQELVLSIRVIVILEETNIRSSQSFLSAVVLPEQVRLEPFFEGGEIVSVPDGVRELIPPLGGQTGEDVLGPGALEQWDHQTVVRRRP